MRQSASIVELFLNKRYKSKYTDFKCNNFNQISLNIIFISGERPFKCSYCGEGFTSLRYVNRHMSKDPFTPEIYYAYYDCDCDYYSLHRKES